MKKIFLAILEILKILVLIALFFILFGILNDAFVNVLFKDTIGNLTEDNSIITFFIFLQGLGIILLLTLIYINKLQYRGFYRSESKKTFSRKTSKILLSLSILFITPFYLSVFIF